MSAIEESGATSLAERLASQAEALRDCHDCALGDTRTTVVFGVGNADADVLFVGEGPGFNEDKRGEPFVGAAGQLLNELLASIGLRREDVYIANVVKCRPPGNRDPLDEEIQACTPHLARQVQAIRPRVICTLGRFATRLLGDTEASMTTVHGRAKETEVFGMPCVVFPIFHPAAALYTPANRTMLEQDFLRLRRLLDRGPAALMQQEAADDGRSASVPPPPDLAETESIGSTPSPVEGPGEAEQLPLW